MPRGYQIEGEFMVSVKGRSDSLIGALTELGLTSEPARISITSKRKDIHVDAYGDVAPETQAFGAYCDITLTLINFDPDVLEVCINEGWGSSPLIGTLGHAGTLMGNGLPLFAPGGIFGNHYISLNLISAIGATPWNFPACYLTENPVDWPLGTEKSVVQTHWRSIPYSEDPWNNGAGSYGVEVYSHTLDT